jgi:predicted XRE-type DNA-binding protein
MTCKGIKNGNAKIKKQGVIDEIRARYAQGGVSQYELADIYGVSQAQINNIILNKQHKAASVNAGAFYTATGGQHHENT